MGGRTPLAVPVPDHPGQLYIPAIGRNFQVVSLVPFSFAWQGDVSGRVILPLQSDERVIQSIGGKPGPNWEVWMDERLEEGDVTASQLRLLLNAHEAASLAWRHLDYFFPQLQPLSVPLQWGTRDLMTLHGPPHSLFVIEGIWKQDVR